MADITVYATVHNSTDNKNAFAGPYWADESNGVMLFIDLGSNLSKGVTSDKGATWAYTSLASGTVQRLRCFYDQEVPGDAGTIVHVAWMESTDHTLYYVDIDAADGTVGTIRTVDATLTVSATAPLNRLAITKTRGGNIIIAGSTQTEIFAIKSADQFATAGTVIADCMETANQEDWVRAYPADTADNQDAAVLFLDRSANELSIKMYDDSADTWTETAIVSMTNSISQPHFDGAVRISDGNLIVALHNDVGTTTDDILVYDISLDSIATPTITAKTNVVTDLAESAEIAVCINQQNDDIYVAYFKGGTWTAEVDVVYKKSTDGAGTWGTETAYSEDTADDARVLAGPRSIGNLGGQVQFSWFNDDLNDIFVNLTNSVEIAAASGGHVLTASPLTSASTVDSPTLVQVHTLTANALVSASSVDSPAITQAHGLTASALASASLVDSPALTQVHDLTGNSLTSASSVGTPILTTVPGSHTLTADSLDSASSVDSPALTQVHGLTATALDSATLLDSPALTQAHILAATALASATSTGSPALGLTSVLVANGLTSASLVGSPALSQVNALSADSLAVATIVDSATLLGGGYSVTVTGGRISNKAIGSRISNKVLGSKIKDLEI